MPICSQWPSCWSRRWLYTCQWRRRRWESGKVSSHPLSSAGTQVRGEQMDKKGFVSYSNFSFFFCAISRRVTVNFINILKVKLQKVQYWNFLNRKAALLCKIARNTCCWTWHQILLCDSKDCILIINKTRLSLLIKQSLTSILW